MKFRTINFDPSCTSVMTMMDANKISERDGLKEFPCLQAVTPNPLPGCGNPAHLNISVQNGSLFNNGTTEFIVDYGGCFISASHWCKVDNSALIDATFVIFCQFEDGKTKIWVEYIYDDYSGNHCVFTSFPAGYPTEFIEAYNGMTIHMYLNNHSGPSSCIDPFDVTITW